MLETGKRKGSAMNIEIAQRLYELRRKHGFSQESLAAELGLSRQAISKWERSESAPDMGNLIALADLYGMTIDELIRPATEGEAEGEDEVRATIETEPTEAIVEEEETAACTDAVDIAETVEDIDLSDEEVATTIDVEADSSQEPPSIQEPLLPQEPTPTSEPMPIQEDVSTQDPAADIKQASTHDHVFTRPPQPAIRPRCALRRFPYPLVVTALFLLLALVFGLWEYMWLFLTIPFYYWICRIIERDPNFLAAHGYSEGGR